MGRVPAPEADLLPTLTCSDVVASACSFDVLHAVCRRTPFQVSIIIHFDIFFKTEILAENLLCTDLFDISSVVSLLASSLHA